MQVQQPRIFSSSFGKSGGRIHLSLLLSHDIFLFIPFPWTAPTFLQAVFALLPPICFPALPAGRPSLDTHAAYCFHMIRGRVAGLGCWSCLFPMVPASSQRVRPARGSGGGGSGGRLAERGSVAVSGPLAVLQSLSCRPSVHVAPTSIHGFQQHHASPATHLRCSLAISV